MGARAVRASILRDFPDDDFRVFVVWINMLPGDTEESARSSSREWNDHRIDHFYDPDKLVGSAIADCLGHSGNVAWDIYLFFSGLAEWKHGLPMPLDWMHQLKDNWADSTRYHTGDRLAKKLLETMNRLRAR